MKFYDDKGNEIALTADMDGVKQLIDEALKGAAKGRSDDKDANGSPDIQAQIDEAVKKATEPVVANKEEILVEKKKLQEKLTTLEEKLDGADLKEVKALLTRIHSDEEAKLIAEGKTDLVIERRTERLTADHKKQIVALEEKLAEANKSAETATAQVKQLRIEGSLRQAGAETGVLPSAVPDLLARAMNVFQVGIGPGRWSPTAQRGGSIADGIWNLAAWIRWTPSRARVVPALPGQKVDRVGSRFTPQ